MSNCQLQQWQNAIACQIQNCPNWEQRHQIWLEIEADINKHQTQYDDKHQAFLDKVWRQYCNQQLTS